MPIEISYLNTRVELLDPSYDPAQAAELRSLLALYNRLRGPIAGVWLDRPDLPDFSIYTSRTAHAALGVLMPDAVLQLPAMGAAALAGSGKGPGQRGPFVGGLAEAAERLGAALGFAANLDRLVFASHRELERAGRRALGPGDLPLFAPEQYARPGFAYARFEHDTPLRWLPGYDLFSGEEVLAPAQLLLMYYKCERSEASIGYATSSGLGLRADWRAGIVHGLFEVIERDAVNVRWHARLAPPRVMVDLHEFLVQHAGLPNARLSTPQLSAIQVFLNTLDLAAPIFTLIAIDQSRAEHAFVGSGGAGRTRERALAQAIFELGQARAAANAAMRAGTPGLPPAEMTSFADAPVYYGARKRLKKLDWYAAGAQTVPWADLPSVALGSAATEFEATLGWLAEHHLRPLVFDLTPPGWPGLSLTKVLIPQLTQAGIPAYPYLGHPRFYELPRRLGLARRRLDFGRLNHDPVPFS